MVFEIGKRQNKQGVRRQNSEFRSVIPWSGRVLIILCSGYTLRAGLKLAEE